MTDAEMFRGLADWLATEAPEVLVFGPEAMGRHETACALRRIADQLGAGPIPSLRERLETAERDRLSADARANDALAEAMELRDALAAERTAAASTIARANAALIKAGDEAGRLREELREVYAILGRITIAEWQARREAEADR